MRNGAAVLAALPYAAALIQAQRRSPLQRRYKTPAPRLMAFIQSAWHVVEPATPFVPGWHLDAIAEHLEAVTAGEIHSLLINMPPRHSKSLMVSVFWPCWEWVEHPERRWLFASYAQSLSTRDSLKCRRLIESPWYQGLWGDRFQLTGDQNAKTRFENTKTGYRLSTSVGGSATGEGGDRVICDDPISINDANSETIRESTLTWWDQTMSSRLNDPKTGARVIVMQRVHERDLSGHVLETGGWEHLSLPAEYEGDGPSRRYTGIGWSDPRTAPGELLWPERFGPAELAKLKRELGSYAAAGQLQQRPSPAEGGIFKRDWWRFWGYETTVARPGETVYLLPAKFDEVIQSWDMAFKDKASSDFVAGGVWARKGADRFLLDQVHDRLSFTGTLRAVRNLSSDWPEAKAKLVEDKANGTAVMDTLQHEIGGLIPIEPEGGKEARAHAVTPYIEAGNVYLPHPSIAPWVEDFIEECASFPKGAYDDQVDQMTQALNRFANGPKPPSTDFAAVSMERPSLWAGVRSRRDGQPEQRQRSRHARRCAL